MSIAAHNPAGVFRRTAAMHHAVEVPAGARTLYISGLNGLESNGVSMPSDFESQAALVWRHLGTILESAAMGYSDLVSLRFYLASAADDPANVEILSSHLDGHMTARTVVVQQLLDPRWLIEVEAIAAKVD